MLRNRPDTRQIARDHFGGNERILREDPLLKDRYKENLEVLFVDIDPLDFLIEMSKRMTDAVLCDVPRALFVEMPKEILNWFRQLIRGVLQKS